jgi:hypothetical protein
VDGRLQVTGKLERPGFYPFEIAASFGGVTSKTTDYFVVQGGQKNPAFDHVGYYVFLGRGDFWDETHPLALWRLYEWKRFADWMSDHGADTLFVLLNGYTLAYPSEKYPELRDRFSMNARTNFLRQFIDYAHTKKIKVYLTLTTDDHAEGFGQEYPETIRINKYGYAPSHRSLVLENDKVQTYLRDTLDEVLTNYGNADGVVLHPSETDPDRFNAETRALYQKETGQDLARAEAAERYRWYRPRALQPYCHAEPRHGTRLVQLLVARPAPEPLSRSSSEASADLCLVLRRAGGEGFSRMGDLAVGQGIRF